MSLGKRKPPHDEATVRLRRSASLPENDRSKFLCNLTASGQPVLMSPDEADKSAAAQPDAAAPRGRRRSRRGGRRHPRRREPRESLPPPTGESPTPPTAAESSQPAVEEAEQRQEQEQPYPEPAHKTPAITDAIEQVNRIIEELKHSLDEMEEVLETLELAERQKIDDEREIQNLQRALRHLHQRPRENEPRH
jgi:hypothetical protein